MSAREATCPRCAKVFDPMRSRFVRVMDGKVVAFCSETCKAAEVVALPAAAAKPVAPKPPSSSPSPPTTTTTTKTTTATATATASPSASASASPSATSRPVTAAGGDDVEEVPRLRPQRWKAALAALAVIVVGGMAIALVQQISPSSPTQVNAAPAEGGAPIPTLDRKAAPEPSPRERAVTVLKELMTSPSPRIARAAAIGLARMCDAGAKAHLVEATKTESSEIARLENAYVIARCGDDSGRQALVAALRSDRRDVKADAARHLVALGEDSGLAFLHALLGVSQHRLGAAEALAKRKDEKAVAALKSIHGASSTEPDDKLRAAIALG
ncbi:MAG: hypothetical protein K8M05_42320, partial [Deltaproteobacteria bacterium]|nr:hypothetical protein [Kofleriaceae bacterium]